MRDIRFRGKRLDNGEWVHGKLLTKKSETFIVCEEETSHGFKGEKELFAVEWSIAEVDPATVGQFTGLTDKAGREIYEGDIVRCKKYIGGNFVEYCYEFGYVEFVYGAFGLHRRQGFYRPFKDWLEDYEFEVIGNIYQNGDLLDEVKPDES